MFVSNGREKCYLKFPFDPKLLVAEMGKREASHMATLVGHFDIAGCYVDAESKKHTGESIMRGHSTIAWRSTIIPHCTSIHDAKHYDGILFVVSQS